MSLRESQGGATTIENHRPTFSSCSPSTTWIGLIVRQACRAGYPHPPPSRPVFVEIIRFLAEHDWRQKSWTASSRIWLKSRFSSKKIDNRCFSFQMQILGSPSMTDNKRTRIVSEETEDRKTGLQDCFSSPCMAVFVETIRLLGEHDWKQRTRTLSTIVCLSGRVDFHRCFIDVSIALVYSRKTYEIVSLSKSTLSGLREMKISWSPCSK